MRSSLLFLCLAVSLSGCADMLGLKNLNYEENEAQPKSADGKPLVTGAGGQGSQEPEVIHIVDDFPLRISGNSLIAAQQRPVAEGPYYWVYEPDTKTLFTYRLRLGADLVGSMQWASDSPWTHLIVVETDDGPELIGYDSESGWHERATDFASDGSFLTSAPQSGNRHTHLFIAADEEQSLLVGYDAESGFYRWVSATGHAVPVGQGMLSPGYSDVVPLHFGDEDGLLFYSAKSGEYKFFVFPDADQGVLIEKITGQLAPERSLLSLASDEEFGPQDVLISYNANDGEMSFFSLSTSEEQTGFVFESQGELLLRRELVEFKTMTNQGENLLLTFDGQSLALRGSSDDSSSVIIR